MILSNVQKHLLVNKVGEMIENFGKNQKKSDFISIIDRTKAYSVETNGELIIYYDYIDPDVFIFNDIEEFRDFIYKNL